MNVVGPKGVIVKSTLVIFLQQVNIMENAKPQMDGETNAITVPKTMV